MLGNIADAAEAALAKVTPKGFRLSEKFSSEVKSRLSQYVAGMKTEFPLFSIAFPKRLSAARFLDEFRKELESRGVKYSLGQDALQFDKARVFVSANKLSMEKSEIKTRQRLQVAFIRLNEFEAKRMLKEAYELLIPPPESPKQRKMYNTGVGAFTAKYAKHVMAASDGLKSGLRAIGQNPETGNWNAKMAKFLEGYCDYIAKKETRDVVPSSDFSLTMGSSADARKFKAAFEAEAKSAIGQERPDGIALNIEGLKKNKLVVATIVQKVQKTEFAEVEKPKRIIQ